MFLIILILTALLWFSPQSELIIFDNTKGIVTIASKWSLWPIIFCFFFFCFFSLFFVNNIYKKKNVNLVCCHNLFVAQIVVVQYFLKKKKTFFCHNFFSFYQMFVTTLFLVILWGIASFCIHLSLKTMQLPPPIFNQFWEIFILLCCP